MAQTKWKTVKRNLIYENKFGYKLYDDDVITPLGRPGKYMVLESRSFAIIVAITKDKKVVMTKQWRYPVGRKFLELPAGGLEEGEAPLQSAKRELLEETGATSNNWKRLAYFWFGNGAMKIKAYVYLAQNAEISCQSQQDETEDIEIKLIDFDQLITMIREQKLHEDRTIIALLLAKDYLERK